MLRSDTHAHAPGWHPCSTACYVVAVQSGVLTRGPEVDPWSRIARLPALCAIADDSRGW